MAWSTDRDEEFQVGQRVIFRPRDGGQWFEGRIRRVANISCSIQQYDSFCEEIPGDSEPPLNQPGETFTVLEACIRPLPEEQGIQDGIIEATMMTPTFQDPFAHLYMESNDLLSDKKEIVTEDGRVFSTAIVALPDEEELRGIIEVQDFFRMANHILNRRRPHSYRGADSINFREVLADALPQERNVRRLTELAKRDASAMLQLGDVLNFGFFGATKDTDRALKVYMSSAWGLSEQEFASNGPFQIKFAYPMGPPEAMCAAALDMWETLESFYAAYNIPNASKFHTIVADIARTNDSFKMSWLHVIVMFLGHAIRRKWTSRFALALGQALRDNHLLDPFIPDSMHILKALDMQNMRENALPPQVKQLMGIPEGADIPPELLQIFSHPSDDQLEKFQPKATEIFLKLPAQVMNPSGLCRSDLHVEYREMPFPPYATILFSFNPQSRRMHTPKKLSDNLKYTPYSQEAFEFLWGRIVFDMHMGDKKGNMRFRPSLITFVDKPGDRQFARYVRQQIGTGSGTEIRIIQTENYYVDVGGRSRRLSDLIAANEEPVIAGVRSMIKWDEHEIMSPADRANTVFQNRRDIPIQELLQEIQRLKDEGHSYFGRQRWLAAKKCYTEAIDKIRVSSNFDNRVHRMLGILLSNRSQCFINMAEGMSPELAINTLKNALVDCEIALNSSWRSSVPEPIQTKLKRRKEMADNRRNRLKSILPNDLFSLPREVVPAGPPSRNANNGLSRRQTHRQRRNRRRRQRNRNRSSDHTQEATVQVHISEEVSGEAHGQEESNVAEGAEGAEDAGDPIAAEEVYEEANGPETRNATSREFCFLLGKDIIASDLAPFIDREEDPCPCCSDRFRVELSEVNVVVNNCGHAFCMPCTAELWKKSNYNNPKVTFTCPICRVPLPEELLSEAIEPVILQTPALKNRLEDLPLSPPERIEVARSLLLKHDFVVGNVLRILDSMLIDNLQASLRRSQALSADEKQQIYEDARRPVVALCREHDELRERLRSMRDHESDECIDIKTRICELESTMIPAARNNARSYVFERMNSAGTMGAENEDKQLEVDFHGLHIDEAKKQFDEFILPVLKAVGSLIVVVGRGNHSEGRVARLKPALKKYIEKHTERRLKHTTVPGNPGAIQVDWSPN